jgi:hypothetical protein
MIYNLFEIERISTTIGFPCTVQVSDQRALVVLREQVTLCFQNSDHEGDCFVAFLGTPWHTHDALIFSGQEGRYVDVQPYELLPLLAEGRVLVKEEWQDGQIVDRSLIHADYNDELKYIDSGEELRIYRAVLGSR